MNMITKCLLLLFILTATVSAGEIWLTDLPAAIKKAEKENKNILVDFTGSDWCGWCIKLKEEVFSQKQFLDYAKNNLILVEVDFPSQKKLPEKLQKANKALAEKYKITGYPTILLLDKTGQQIGKTGYQDGGAAAYAEHLKSEIKKGVAKLEKKNKQAQKVLLPGDSISVCSHGTESYFDKYKRCYKKISADGDTAFFFFASNQATKATKINFGKKYSSFKYDADENMIEAVNESGDLVKAEYNQAKELIHLISHDSDGIIELKFEYNSAHKPVHIAVMNTGFLNVTYNDSNEIDRVNHSTMALETSVKITKAMQNLSNLASLGNGCNLESHDESTPFKQVTSSLNGKWTSYYQNGKIKLSGHTKNDLPDSVWTCYAENGIKKSETQYKNGILCGFTTEFYDNGQISKNEIYKDGKLEGECKEYYPNGQLTSSSFYKNGELNGNSLRFNENGALTDSSFYASNKRQGLLKQFYGNNHLKSISNYIDDLSEGVYTEYFENGQIAVQGSYLKGSKSGNWIQYYENGQISENNYYSDGDYEGEQVSYYKNGQMASRETYKAGEVINTSTYYDEEGKIITYEEYFNKIMTDSFDND